MLTAIIFVLGFLQVERPFTTRTTPLPSPLHKSLILSYCRQRFLSPLLRRYFYLILIFFSLSHHLLNYCCMKMFVTTIFIQSCICIMCHMLIGIVVLLDVKDQIVCHGSKFYIKIIKIRKRTSNSNTII